MKIQSKSASAQDARVDRAWWILVGAGLCIFCGQPAALLFTFGVFVPEIVAATHWPQVIVASAIGPGTVVTALLSPLVGHCADRFGVKNLILVGAPAWGLGLILLGQMPHDAFAFVIFLILACGLGFAATPVLYAQLVTGWFSTRRGLALSVMFGCSSLGVGFWSPCAAGLLHFGWRNTYTIIGLLVGSVIFLVAIFLLRNPPKVEHKADEAHLLGHTLLQAIGTIKFWKIAIAFMLLTGALSGGSVNLPVILHQNHVPAELAASVMSVVGLSMFFGMVSMGFLLDMWFAPYVTAGFALIPLTAFIVLEFNHSTIAFFLAAAGIGGGLGSELNAGAFMVSRAFGARAFGAIYGLVTLAFGLSTAAGPAFAGAALAKSVNVNVVFGIAIALIGIAIALLLSLRKSDMVFAPAKAQPAASSVRGVSRRPVIELP